MTNYLSPSELSAALALRDFPTRAPDRTPAAAAGRGAGPASHAWPIPHDVRRTSPLVAVADNYDNLGYSPAAVTRDARYSRYVSPTVMLRSHTSAGVPAGLRSMSGADEPAAGAAGSGLSARCDRPDPCGRSAPGRSVADPLGTRSAPVTWTSWSATSSRPCCPGRAGGSRPPSIPTPRPVARSTSGPIPAGSSCSSAGWPRPAYSARQGSTPLAGRGSHSAWGWTAR